MALTSNQIDELLRVLHLTKSQELGCEECLRKLAEYAEYQLQGKSIPDSLALVRDHLELCRECSEEFQVLLLALEEISRGD